MTTTTDKQAILESNTFRRLLAEAGYADWAVRNEPFSPNDSRLGEPNTLWVNRIKRLNPRDDLESPLAVQHGMTWSIGILVPTDEGGRWLHVYLNDDLTQGIYEK